MKQLAEVREASEILTSELGAGYSPKSIYRNIRLGHWQMGVEYVDLRNPNALQRKIRVKVKAILKRNGIAI
jgi:hypothetical protein